MCLQGFPGKVTLNTWHLNRDQENQTELGRSSCVAPAVGFGTYRWGGASGGGPSPLWHGTLCLLAVVGLSRSLQ